MPPVTCLPLALLLALSEPPTASGETWGYRFVLKGDFDGDGREETLTEHFLEGRTRKESPKAYEGIEYDRLVELTCEKEPLSVMTCSQPGIRPLVVGRGGQLLGVAYARNEGDLLGDGQGDVVSLVVDAADWSALNSCRLVAFRDGRWRSLATFPIHEHWLPPLPQVQPLFGLFGVAGQRSTAGDAGENRRLERRLKAFPGLVRKLGPGRIRARVYERADEATRVLTLAYPRRP